MILVLSSPEESPVMDLDETYFTVMHLLLAMLAGFGFMLIGAASGRPIPKPSPEQILSE
jgi:hypothetical protein